MPKALINGINMYYEEHGTGFPVLFTHGFAGTTRMWDGQVPALSRRYRFITYDMRGHGQTDVPEEPSRYALDCLVEDIHQLLQHLEIQRAVIGGLSLGGYLTIHFYHQHPEMAAAVILMDTGPGYRSPEKARAWNQSRIECAKVLETQGIKGFLASEYSGNVYYTPPDLMMKHNPKGLANVSRGLMMNIWGLDILPTIKVPALVICGDKDVDFLAPTDYMARKIPNSRKVIIPNAAHAVNIDQPQIFASTVLGFLDGLRL